MNKNNIFGFLLIAVVLIGFSWYNQPSAEEQRAAFVQDSIAKAKHAEMEKASKTAAVKRQANAKAKIEADSTALFYSALKGQAQKVVLKNEKVELTLNTKGGTVEKAVIKGYVGHNLKVKDGSADQKDVTLFDGNDQSLKFMLEAKGGQHHHQRSLFHTIQRDRQVCHHDCCGWSRQDPQHDLYSRRRLYAPHEPAG